MRAFVILALAGASIAAPFKNYHFGASEYDEDFRPHPRPTKPSPTGGLPPYPIGSSVLPLPSETDVATPVIPSVTGVSTSVIPSGTGISTPVIPSGTAISTPAFPSGTGIIPSGTGFPTPTDIYNILPYIGAPPVTTPTINRRGLEIDYKLAPRFIQDGAFGGGQHSHPHRPHGTGYPHWTGRPLPTGTGKPYFPFPTGTSGSGRPTAVPKLLVPIYVD